MTPTGPVQLPGLDAAFLGLEASRQTGHVGSLAVLDPSGLDVPDDTYDAITDWARTQLGDTLD